MDWNTSGVYAIAVSDGVYVGSGKSVRSRWGNHLYLLERGRHHSAKLQDAYDRGGELEYILIEECAVSDLTERESFWGRILDVDLLNTAPPGSAIYPRTAETKSKTSASAYKQWATPERLRRKYAMLECISLGMQFTAARKFFGFHHATARKWVDDAAA